MTDDQAEDTLIVVGRNAPRERVAALSEKVRVWEFSGSGGRVDLKQLLRRLGRDGVTSLLVEGGGEVNGQFLRQKLAHRIAFYLAPKILGGRASVPGVAGDDPKKMLDALNIADLTCEPVGHDWYFTGLVSG